MMQVPLEQVNLKHSNLDDFIQGSLFSGLATYSPTSELLLILRNSSLLPPRKFNSSQFYPCQQESAQVSHGRSLGFEGRQIWIQIPSLSPMGCGAVCPIRGHLTPCTPPNPTFLTWKMGLSGSHSWGCHEIL